MKVLIIGGVAGGASAAARLRRLDEDAEIIILERGEHISYANCGLPYYIGGEIEDRNKLLLQTPQSFRSRSNIDVRVKNEVIAIDPAGKGVIVKDLNMNKMYTESYDKIILSMGAKPILPRIEGCNFERIFQVRDISDIDRIKNYIERDKPCSAVVVGGGYIGIEMAENLRKAGLDVTVVELMDHIIAPLDFDMAADVHKYLSDNGIKLILNTGVEKIENNGRLKVSFRDDAIDTDMVIMAVGVRPETEIAKNAGILVNERGSIIVDQNMKTNISDIYAVGDAVEVKDFVTKDIAFVPLAGPANKQGRIAADSICGIYSEYTGTQGSAVIKIFGMTVAMTGINERAAQNAGIDYEKTYIYSDSHAKYYPGATKMGIKVLWEKKTERLIGAQIVGFDGVDKRIDVLATAIRFRGKVTDLMSLELCYAPPVGSAKDPINMVGFVAENIIKGKVKQYFWYDVSSIPRDGSILLFDVRSAEEHQNGNIEGSINLPLNELREKLYRFPGSSVPIYIYCDSGLRSYIACRMLSGMGYRTFNLAGGYRLYSCVIQEKKAKEINCK